MWYFLFYFFFYNFTLLAAAFILFFVAYECTHIYVIHTFLFTFFFRMLAFKVPCGIFCFTFKKWRFLRYCGWFSLQYGTFSLLRGNWKFLRLTYQCLIIFWNNISRFKLFCRVSLLFWNQIFCQFQKLLPTLACSYFLSILIYIPKLFDNCSQFIFILSCHKVLLERLFILY